MPGPTTRPLTLLLTRPREASAAFAQALEAAAPGRFEAVIAPVMEMAQIGGAPDLAGAQALLFTSSNGVAAFAAVSAARGLPAFCVGDETARAARAAGFRARSAGGDAAGLAALVAEAVRPEGGALLHVRGIHAAGDLAGRLAAAGFETRALALYDQRETAIGGAGAEALAAGRVDVAAGFSPRSAALFARQARAAGWDLSRTTLVSLSAAADAAHAAPEPARRLIAAEPTRAAMIAALAGL